MGCVTNTDQRIYTYGFSRVKGIGPVRMRLLQSHFGSLADAWQAEPGALMACGLETRLINALITARDHLDLNGELDHFKHTDIQVLTWDDPNYPKLLHQISDPPPVLYVRGSLSQEDEYAVGIVGTRQASVYGRQVAEMLAGDLAHSHVTVVSGMARGIDASAHLASIKSGGRTIAVLGCGVDVIYPPENRALAQDIIQHGALISDYPPGSQPDALNFPPRNRIISGLSLGVVIVEADQRSGALITADYASQQGRDVFAVPGNIFNRSSRGTNQLIHDGAKMVLSVKDVLEELNLGMVESYVAAQQVVPENDVERALIAHMSHEPVLTDELIDAVDLPTEVVTSTLAMMELKGMVRQANGTSYVLVRDESVTYGSMQ
jgi:DNA processing protein